MRATFIFMGRSTVPLLFFGGYGTHTNPDHSNLMVFNLNLLFDFSGKPVTGTAS